MSIIAELLFHIGIVIYLRRCCHILIIQGVDGVHLPQQQQHQHTEQHRRLWNDSYIWPAPQYEVYEQLQTAHGINTTRVIYSNDWKFVYDINGTTYGYPNPDHATERWSIIMSAAKDRFQYFLNQSITNANMNLLNQKDEAKLTSNPNNVMIPLEGVHFHISNFTETTLHHGMDESYTIQILNPSVTSKALEHGSTTGSILNTSNFIEVTATNVFGAMYALETLKQIIQFVGYQDDDDDDDDDAKIDDNGDDRIAVFAIFNSTYKLYIQDSPVYTYRGIMIDTARHFLPLHLIHQNLFAMHTNKLNVLHWHISDTQSFPYASMKFPELARQGAYCYPECTYNATDIAMIIETAALLGIHVIIEIDLPTHSQAIGNSHPELLSKCSNGILSEPLNVTDEALYKFVYDLYDEVTVVFTDDYIHLGGDEVSLECWENSTNLQGWMRLHNMTKTVEVLQYFEMNLLDYVLNVSKKRPIVWQDLFDMDVKGIPSTVIYDVWKNWIMEGSVFATTAANYDILFSACWYLDHLNENWWSFYTCNPRNMPNLTSAQQDHILGGHSSMWGESVDSTNFYERVWPRSSATAEVLWSGNPRHVTTELSFDHIQMRLSRFRCYMLVQFDIPISPITPGHCQAHGPLLVEQ